MSLHLHIFGPAFGLPSIDPECLAAILYLQKAVPRPVWQLVASNSIYANPFRRLPAIYDTDEDLWVAGYDNIVTYLSEKSVEEWTLDSDLSTMQQADSTAYTTYVRSRGAPLLDLSLYVSSDNYNAVTRPAWGELLAWPGNWTLPHTFRDQARKRSEHLGLNDLDVDAAREQAEKKENEGMMGQIPKGLRKSRQTVSQALGRTAQHTKFRLEAVTQDFFEVLMEKLEEGLKLKESDHGSGLVGPGFHSVDCLAVAYLTLMQIPTMPQGWLREELNGRYQVLGHWAKIHARSGLGLGLDEQNPLLGGQEELRLPWVAAPRRSFVLNTQIAIETIIASIPVISGGYEQSKVSYAASSSDRRTAKDRQAAYLHVRNKQRLYSQVVTTVLTTSSLLAWLLHAGILPMPSQRRWSSPLKRTYGEAGMLLGLR